MGVMSHSGARWSRGAGTPLCSDRGASEALPGGVGAPRASKGSCTSALCPIRLWAAPEPMSISQHRATAQGKSGHGPHPGVRPCW